MSTPMIIVENLSKRYRIGTREESYKTIREAIIDGFKAPVRNFRKLRKLTKFDTNPSNTLDESGELNSSDVIWALKDVSFEVSQGEVVGIIGPNGAGKSTLLKVLSRITHPTSGDIKLYGRVSSLLEVGTGFHQELTGRENIYLNGAILGMRKAEIDRKFDQIVAFSEIEKFIDTPVKRYSSGMYVRLAFAVSAHLEPEILLVDEVLAVGDAAFQKKCLGKMGKVAKEGRTVLFVSHNMTAIQSLCSRVFWLNNGQIVETGETNRVVSHYLESGTYALKEQVWDDPATAPGNEKVRLHYARVTPLNQEPGKPITVKTALQLEFAFWNFLPNAMLNFSVVLDTLEGVSVFNVGSFAQVFATGLVSGSFVIPGDFLNDAVYTVWLLIVKDSSIVLYDRREILIFEVNDVEREGNWYGKLPGVVRPQFDWQINAISLHKSLGTQAVKD
jgi:lipopolysaccharide transport system ATP-binding protein